MSTIYREYELTYTVDASQSVPALGNIQRELFKTDQAAGRTRHEIDQLNASLAAMGQQASGAFVPGVNSATSATQGFGASVAGLATSWFVLEHGIEAIGKFGELANKARETMRELAEDVRATRDDFRELANLKGHDGPDDEVLAETIGAGAQTGMMPAEARRYMEQFLGSSPAGEQKGNIDEATSKQVALEGMRFGNRVKLAPSTAGDLAGVMSQYGKIPDVQTAAGKMGKIAYGLNEGRGNLEPLMRSLIKTAGAVVREDGGPTGSLEELSAIMGVASTHASPDAAGTKVRKAVRELRQFSGEQGSSLQRLGITTKDTYMEALGKIAPGILKADKEGHGGDSYLRNLGFKDETAITAIVEQARDYEVIEQRIENQKKISGSGVMAQNRNYLMTDKNGQSRIARATKAAQDYKRGQQQEQLQIARDAAEVEMRNDGSIGGLGNQVQEMFGDWFWLKPRVGVRKTRDRWLDERAFKNAQDKLLQAKLDTGMPYDQAVAEMKKEHPTFNPDKMNQGAEGVDEYWLNDQQRAKSFDSLATGATRQGLNPYTDNSKRTDSDMKELIHETRITNSILASNRTTAGMAGGIMNPLAIAIEAGKAAVAPTR